LWHGFYKAHLAFKNSKDPQFHHFKELLPLYHRILQALQISRRFFAIVFHKTLFLASHSSLARRLPAACFAFEGRS
jgi:hypothetical protein